MQSKKHSLIESLSNTAIGFIISLTSSYIIFPLCGIEIKPLQNLYVTICYTIVSILRQYIIRRFFNKKELKKYDNK